MMFRKLRNRLIWINLGITTVVIVLVFSVIYFSSTQSANMRPDTIYNNTPAVPENNSSVLEIGNMDEYFRNMFSEQMQSLFRNSIQDERNAAARQLLTTLIISGIMIEIAVALISYLLAEEAIKPVKEAYDSQKIFIANASHEIKTPLAAISANLEAADIHGNRFIENVERETEKLTTLNKELLTLARTDTVSETIASEVSLGEMVEKDLKSYKPRMKDIRFKSKISVGRIKINATDFMQIFDILLDNAIKYAKKEINLTLTEHTLTISNDGAKIKPDEIGHIFERFFQADKSSEGVGLGLAIAKSAADRNHWKLSAESKRITTFRLDF